MIAADALLIRQRKLARLGSGGSPRALEICSGAGGLSLGLQTAGIETAFIDPGKPWQNGTDESFNGKLRDQHLSLQWFRNRADAKVSIEQWRRHYNEVRPHSSLKYMTPAVFKAKHLADLAEGRSPAMPARADDDQKNDDDRLTSPISGILQ